MTPMLRIGHSPFIEELDEGTLCVTSGPKGRNGGGAGDWNLGRTSFSTR